MLADTPSPANYELLFGACPSACLVLDLDIVDVNAAYLRVMGRTREGLLGQHVFDAFPENPSEPGGSEVSNLRQSFGRVLTLQTVDQIELRYDIPTAKPEPGNFETRYWSSISAPVFDRGGRLTHIIQQAIDVTARVEAENSLRTNEHRFLTLTHAAGSAIYRMSPSWSHMAELDGRGFIKDTQEPNPWRIEDYIPPEDVDHIREKIEAAIRDKAIFDHEHRVLRADGSRGWTHSRAVPMLDDNGEITEWIGSATDISIRKLAEEQLQDANQKKDEFLAMLAHELRNPLAPIAAAADLMRLAVHDETRTRKAGEIVARQVRHLSGLVDDLLDVSRVTRGHVVLDRAPGDMRRIVEDAIEQVRPLIESRRHHLQFRTTPYAAMVNGDAKRLTQVVTNLLTNANRYTPEQGRISVSLEQDETSVNVVVSDNGMGMTPALMARSFDLFVQGDRSPEREAGGLGIGLALVKSLTELHGGRVDVHSDGEGQGTHFTVVLPKASPDELSDSPDAPGPVVRASRPLRVFVVDDNSDAAEMLTLLIDHLGHEARVETHSRAALEYIVVEQPDVCLLDIGMPDLDGYQLARAIRSRLGAATPVLVAVSGYSQPQDRAAARDAGFAEHFAKPADNTSLARFFSTLVPRPR